MKQKEAQDKKIKDLEEFIAKNKARAATATLAQSKVKILEKMEVMEDIVYEKDLKFDFNYKDTSAKYLLEVKDVSFGYDKSNILFKDITFALSRGETLGIIGKNGKGKSTLLNVVAEGNNRKKNRITAYTEDKENILFVKAILKSKAFVLDFVDVTLPCSTLMELVTKRVPAFIYPYSIVILDGDVRMNKNDLRKINNADNILILPGNKSPERLLASYLYNLSDVDPLWSKIADGYTKQFCFREYSMEQINAGGELGRQNAIKWFNSQLEYWGRNGCKVLNPFLSSISEEAQEFRTNFDNMIKQYIHD
jgi:energy-coupling factor transporter ATP-binding protein EcfA2